MKTILRCMIPAAGLLIALPALRAQEPAPAGQNETRTLPSPDEAPPPPHGLRRMGHHRGPQEMETVTFLGVEARPVDEALSDQLNLMKGAGLIVRNVGDSTPAATVLRTNDVLVKLDDQLLIEPRQLSVLIRSHQEGDEVTLTYIRGGKQDTAKVKLAKHEVPKMAAMDSFPGQGMFNVPFGGDEDNLPGVGREDMDRVLALIDQGAPLPRMGRMQLDRQDVPNVNTVTVNTSNSNMVFSDEKGSLDLTIKEGKKTLVAKNAKGEQIFSGPVNTPDERKALPADVRERLGRLEGMQEFSFQTDENFQGGKLQVAPPAKTKIALPPGEQPAPLQVRGSAAF